MFYNNKIKRNWRSDDSNRFLTFTANTANSTVALHSYHTDTTTFNGTTYTNTPAEKCPNVIALEYSTNGVTWNPYTFTDVFDENDDVIGFTGQVITLPRKGDYVMLRASADNRFQWVTFSTHATGSNRYDLITGWYQFIMTGSIKATGNIMTLLYKAGANFSLDNRGGFYKLFLDCTALTVAPYLSATVLPDDAYAFMFQGCTNLTKVSFTSKQMEASNRGWQFIAMFKECSSLVNVSDLSIHLDGYSRRVSFNQMFYGCTSLVNVPKITTREGGNNTYSQIGDDAYYYMFKGCTNILDASHVELHNPNAAVYASKVCMFENCTKLQYPPVIINGFFNGMPSRHERSCKRFFHNCQALKEIILDHDYPFSYFTGSTPPTWGWVDGVPETGDFFKRPDFPLIRCKHMIPLKWRVHDIDNRPLCFETEVANNTITFRKIGEPDPWYIQYSTDGSTWQDYEFNTPIPMLNIGDKVYFRTPVRDTSFTSFYKTYLNCYKFETKGENYTAKCSGNLMTLVRYMGVPFVFSSAKNEYMFCRLFLGCAITSMPDVPDFPLPVSAMEQMFNTQHGITSITLKRKERPDLSWRRAFLCMYSLTVGRVYVRSNILRKDSFISLFQRCSKLNRIETYLNSWTNGGLITQNWVDGVAESGTFVCPKSLDTSIRDISHVPVGWTVKHWYEEMGEQYPSVAALMQQYTDLEDVVDTYPNVAAILDQYPNLVHSLVSTGSTPYMKMYGDGMKTDIYPHELMEMVATFEMLHGDAYSFDIGSRVANGTGQFYIATKYNSSSDKWDRMVFGDGYPGVVNFSQTGKHTYSISANGAYIDGTKVSGSSIQIGQFYSATETSNSLKFVNPIGINRTFGGLGTKVTGEEKFYEVIIKEDSVVTHRLVPIADRVIADIGDLDNIKIYQCTIASDTQTEQRTSVFGLE